MATNVNNASSATVAMWTETEMITLNKCEVYACALHRLIQQLKSDGTTDVNLPQFPKSELSQILNGGIVRENKQILRGTDLDEYLRKHLVEVHVNVTDSLQLLTLDIGNIDRNTPIADVISNIKKRTECL